MKRLQVFLENKWQYVFCRDELKRDPVTTENKSNAIIGDDHSLEYFVKRFGNHEFRISK